jgi:dephospho-CoA kinase
MVQIGLTGGIASGKSTVSRLLSELGARIIDADAIARAIVAPGQDAWRQIVDYFGDPILCPDGSINRRKLGDIVFSNTEKRNRLEDITHPAIWRQAAAEAKQAEAAGYRVVVLDVPLLLETGWDRKVDAVWVVYVDRQTQIQRLIARDSLTPQQAELRIASQLSLEEKRQRADAVIDNSGSPEATRRQVKTLWERLRCDA